MGISETGQTVLIIAAVLAGLVLGKILGVAGVAGSFIRPFLILMLICAFYQVPPRGLANTYRHGDTAVEA